LLSTQVWICTPDLLLPAAYLAVRSHAESSSLILAITHGALTPVDVVKTRIQLDPVVYNRGLIGGIRQVISNEGAGALLTGFGPTALGYFLQGTFKFGGYELFKSTIINNVGVETATNNRTAVYLAAAGVAEFFADVALCPLEATRIRLVSQPAFANGLIGGFGRILREEGVMKGFYSGFVPILFKQVPYTMAKFVVFERTAEAIYKSLGKPKESLSTTTNTLINLSSGVVAGTAAAIVSQPADTLLSKMNKSAGLPGEGTLGKLGRLARETGTRGLFGGLGPRIVMVATLTSGQFAIYGDCKRLMGVSKGVELAKPAV